VPLSQFQLWQARFVREDGFFTFFGLILVACGIFMLRLHHRAAQAAQAAHRAH